MQIAQDWSEKLTNHTEYWFEDPETGLSLSYYINQEISNKLSASTILKGDFGAILEKINSNQTLLEEKWKRLGIGITQNDEGTLNITIIYTE